MDKIIALSLLLTSLASASVTHGVVSGVENCGSAGRLISVEATDCDAAPCLLIPGNSYEIKVNFSPSASTNQLAYKVTAVIDGQEMVLVDLPAPGDVSEGQVYSLSHDLIVSNELLPEMTITVRFEIWDNATGFRQICASAQAVVG